MAERAGTRIRVTAVQFTEHDINVGDVLVWGNDSRPVEDYNGFTWFQSGNCPNYGICGWIQYELAEDPATTECSPVTLASVAALLGACSQLGPRALTVLTAVAERLALGAREHGDFPTLERDWERESLEEQLDDLVYRTVKQLRSCGRL
jgi:hypothetical protein